NNVSTRQKMGTIAGIQLNKFSPNKIQKIVKNRIITKPNPTISMHSNPLKPWTVLGTDHQNIIDKNLKDLTNELEHVDIMNEAELRRFISSWILQQHQKVREPVKRIPIYIKQLLETMFHAGTANPRNKMTTAEMRCWKHAMALQAIEAAKHTLNARESLETS
ncbi:1235_t:CDS:2, partial [Funneliformis caledonium]